LSSGRQKRVQPTLEESVATDQHRTFLEKAQSVAHVGSWVAELDGSARLSWSAEAHRIFDIPVEDFSGTADAFFGTVHPNDLTMVRAAGLAAMHDGRPYDIEHRIVTGTGEVRWVHGKADVERGPDGRPIRMIGTVQDITDRRQLEEQLRHAQKMEAVGRLAGGVAHDLNNALTAIIGYTELVLSQVGEDRQVHRDVEEIRRAAARAASVAQQLLAFSRKQLLDPRVFDLNKIVADLARLLERTLGADISLRTVLAPDLPSIVGDPGQVEQALVNLVVNARDAMPRGGQLVIPTKTQEMDEGFARAHAGMTPGRFVTLSVTDTGHGLDPDTQAHIFEPFFTTKDVDKGTGLGLAMVYSTVKQSGGFIFVDSEVGKGATFNLYFPAIRESDPPRQFAFERAASSTPTILVVEDEPSILNLVGLTLRPDGYRLLRATSGRDALDLAASFEGPIDLLLTDAKMPGMGGIELVRELRSRRPGLPVIVMSGYTQELVDFDGRSKDILTLQKPFSPADLRARIREGLAYRQI
jgi:two-component system, cell cycle sensor histidine kinase and response regulator CckA